MANVVQRPYAVYEYTVWYEAAGQRLERKIMEEKFDLTPPPKESIAYMLDGDVGVEDQADGHASWMLRNARLVDVDENGVRTMIPRHRIVKIEYRYLHRVVLDEQDEDE